jgi:hypothetical protein
MTRKTKNQKCPKCESKEVIPIAYGYPSEKMLEKADRDEVTLGGCCVAPNQP